MLRLMGEKTGAFTPVFSDDPASLTARTLARFDGLLFNNTTHLNPPEDSRQAILGFLAAGKGIIGIHAANDNFYEWPEGAEIMGGLFDNHPWTADGTWAVKIDDPTHPIAAPFEGRGFLIKDEIYQTKGPYSRDRLRVLLSLDMENERNLTVDPAGIHRADRDIAIAWLQEIRGGRSFYSSLGHNHEVYANPAVLRHYLAGIQWALGDLEADATPSARLSPMPRSAVTTRGFEELARRDFGGDPNILFAIEEEIRLAPPKLRPALEKRMLDVVRSRRATFAARQFAGRMLRRVGTERSVPPLARLLEDERLSEVACFALAGITDPAADKALRRALSRLDGPRLVGVIEVIGLRRDPEAVAPLTKLAASADPAIANAALGALARIATPDALAALPAIPHSAATEAAWCNGVLACAEATEATDPVAALEAFSHLYGSGFPSPVRAAALVGITRLQPDRVAPDLLTALRSDDRPLRQAALGAIIDTPSPTMTLDLAGSAAALEPEPRALLIGAFARRNDPLALPAAVAALNDHEEPVRIAALGAIGALGNEALAPLLIDRLDAEKSEADAARASLAALRGDGVDAVLASRIPSAEPEVAAALLRILGERQATESTPALLAATASENPAVRQAAWRAVGTVGDPVQLRPMLDRLLAARTDEDRAAAEWAFVTLARRQDDPQAIVQPLLRALPAKPGPASETLLSIAGQIGGDRALTAVANAAWGTDPALKSTAVDILADWPDASAAPDLLALASNEPESGLRTAALHSYLRLVGKDTKLPPDDKLAMLLRARSLISQPEGARLFLSGLQRVPDADALAVASEYLTDPAVAAEAGAAVLALVELLPAEDSASALRRVAETSPDADTVKRASARLVSLQSAATK